MNEKKKTTKRYIKNSNDRRKNGKELLCSIAECIPGLKEVVGVANVISSTSSFIKNYRDTRFTNKLLYLLNGLELTDEEYLCLSAKLSEYDFDKDANIYRLLDCINAAQTFRQIHYMTNATRYLASGLAHKDNSISLSDYFRVITALSQTNAEDIEFLKDHIKDSYINECLAVEGLAATGLMWHSGIDAGSATEEGHQQYSFNKIAVLVYNYACLLDDVDNNPAGKKMEIEENQKVDLTVDMASTEDIDHLFDN